MRFPHHFTVILLAIAANAHADSTPIILEGISRHSGEPIDYSLVLIIDDQSAGIAVQGIGCLGEVSGKFQRQDRLTWVLTASDPDFACELVIKDNEDETVETIQGPGCSAYHGAACGLSGVFSVPGSNGLAPVFDPAT
ncbi:hypothetical protein [Thalassobius sp. I31.1]|uniref:hypothetical protein n=1 Tax=Thalassobius sp. I31.1 TaxID=2109912 RepID=UPI001300B0FA|nr:hypothetical protein [Thalassobius sp. I31.1]